MEGLEGRKGKGEELKGQGIRSGGEGRGKERKGRVEISHSE